MIIPKFNKERIASPDAIQTAHDSLIGYQKKREELSTPESIAKRAKNLKRIQKLQAKQGAEASGKKVSNSGKKPTQTAIKNQNKAADTYVIKSKKALTPEEKERNAAARSYKTTIPASPVKKSKIKGQSEGAAGRPNTNAASKPIKPTKPSTAKATVNKTGARNVRGATKPPTVASVPKVTKPVGAGRRANGAPKSK